MASFGYARVSTPDQSLDRQLDELRAHGCERAFAEAASGKRGAHRPDATPASGTSVRVPSSSWSSYRVSVETPATSVGCWTISLSVVSGCRS